MDDVLLQPIGYKRALSETVHRVGLSLGFENVYLNPEDIDFFEAAGSTSEWDTAAICAALLLIQVWDLYPNVRLPESLKEVSVPHHDLQPPDLRKFAITLANHRSVVEPILTRAERLLTTDLNGLSNEQRMVIQSILRGSRRIERSLTFQIFQELVLGSQAYSQTYRTAPKFSVKGTLERFDRPALTPESYHRLKVWLDHPDHASAIITNRPSMTPDGEGGTPEAEIGARITGLERIPLIGLGTLSWYSTRSGLDQEAYLKPSPVHALTGLLAALGESIGSALEAAVSLTHNDPVIEWGRLKGVQVWIFEDSVKGLHSLQMARRMLAKRGICFKMKMCGITTSEPKSQVLLRAGAEVYPDLNDALDRVLD